MYSLIMNNLYTSNLYTLKVLLDLGFLYGIESVK